MKTIFVILAVSAPVLAGPRQTRSEAQNVYDRAYELFATRTASGLGESLELFRRASELDPRFAEAHAGEADAACLLALYGFRPPLDVMPRAQDAATKALAIDPSLAEARAALGLTHYLYEWNSEKAQASFERAIAADPGYGEVRHWYAMMLMATGRYEEALAQIDEAMKIAPTRALYAVKRGTILIAASRYEDAAAHLSDVARRHPEYSTAYREQGRLALELGRPEEARRALERAAELPGGGSATTLSSLALALGLLGERDGAEEILHALEARRREGYVSPIAFAVVRLGLDDREGALDALDAAYEARDAALVYIGVQPAFASLRDEPRFAALVERVGVAVKPRRGAP